MHQLQLLIPQSNQVIFKVPLPQLFGHHCIHIHHISPFDVCYVSQFPPALVIVAVIDVFPFLHLLFIDILIHIFDDTLPHNSDHTNPSSITILSFLDFFINLTNLFVYPLLLLFFPLHFSIHLLFSLLLL